MQSLTAFLLAPILALAVATAPVSQEKSLPEKKRSCGTVISPEQIKAELTRPTELTRKSSAARRGSADGRSLPSADYDS